MSYIPASPVLLGNAIFHSIFASWIVFFYVGSIWDPSKYLFYDIYIEFLKYRCPMVPWISMALTLAFSLFSSLLKRHAWLSPMLRTAMLTTSIALFGALSAVNDWKWKTRCHVRNSRWAVRGVELKWSLMQQGSQYYRGKNDHVYAYKEHTASTDWVEKARIPHGK